MLPSRVISQTLRRRVLSLASLFATEVILLSVWLDTDSLPHGHGLIRIMRDWGPLVLRGVITFAVIFATFAWLKYKAVLQVISKRISHDMISGKLFLGHGCSMLLFGMLSWHLYGGAGSGTADSLIAASWWIVGISAIAFGTLAFLPFRVGVQLIRSTGPLWFYALMSACAVSMFGDSSRWTWQSDSYVSRLTFALSKTFLKYFVSGVVAIPQTLVLGTAHFRVKIAPQCSGLEGIALILAFELLWFAFFSEECRFPHSLILIPAGVVLVFVLNAVRIAALILIGNAGAEQIALHGFHSQAGWIAFSLVAVLFCFAVQKLPWLTTRSDNVEPFNAAAKNPTAAFLLPFLTILAAGMVAGAFTADFEWLYPLRFFAAAAVLWTFRARYKDLTWKCDWLAPVIGATVFVVWIGLDYWSKPKTAAGIPTALLASSTFAAVIWVILRILAVTVTVPLAEELAFRGFLFRRLIEADFEAVSLQRFSWFGLVGSSVVFGALHGEYWLAACIAGILFGLAMTRGGSIGQAVVAHATANGLLAAYVLLYHQWHLW